MLLVIVHFYMIVLFVVYLSFKNKFYKDRLHFCTFKVDEGGSKVNGGESR